MPKISSKKLKPVFMWAIKYRSATHKTAMDYYKTKKDAFVDFNTIPPNRLAWMKPRRFCKGDCSVGCSDDYEIVRVKITQF